MQRARAISDCMNHQFSKLKKTKKKVLGLEFELKQAKLALATVDQLKLDLGATMDARDAGYTNATEG